MATREARWPAALWCAAALLAGGCSIGNLTYAEVERDLDAIVRIDGQGDQQRLVYRSDAEQSSWYTRFAPLVPLKPLLRTVLRGTHQTRLENPSAEVRDLLAELGPKAGGDLGRGAGSVRRLAMIAHLDSSALNRIIALNGLATLADAHGFDLTEGLDRGALRLESAPELPQWLEDFAALRPAQRAPVGAPLPADQAARYRAVLAGLCSQPLPQWTQRLALVADLAAAWHDERDPALRAVTADALRSALRHGIQWSVVLALLGREPEWVEVRVRALELLHRAGGPDSVPLLLALLITPPDRIATGEPPFETHETMQRRLIHLCGQLDRDRALRSMVLPGRETWQETCPAEYLAHIALEDDLLLSPGTLAAREALALSLGRPRLQLDGDPDAGAGGDAEAGDWVQSWFAEFTRQRVQR
ncbi:MAG: hypothetical protein AB7O97_15760 [Planctomycetota bacterium]